MQNHPKPQKNGIPIGQFLCIRRNCTNLEQFQQEAFQMYKCFCEKGYSHKVLRRAKKRAIDIDRRTLLGGEQKNNTNHTRFITKYG